MSEDAVRIVGPVICRVFDNEDPRDIGRVRFTMPGLEEPHSLWAVPCGWGVPFYSGGPKYRPPPRGANIRVEFEHNDYYDGLPMYMPLHCGFHPKTGQMMGPAAIRTLHEQGKETKRRHVIFEDDFWQFYIDSKSLEKGDDEDLRQVVLREKSSGTGITINATDGESTKAMTVTISARTGVTVECEGITDINGGIVQIKKRRVMPKPSGTGTI